MRLVDLLLARKDNRRLNQIQNDPYCEAGIPAEEKQSSQSPADWNAEEYEEDNSNRSSIFEEWWPINDLLGLSTLTPIESQVINIECTNDQSTKTIHEPVVVRPSKSPEIRKLLLQRSTKPQTAQPVPRKTMHHKVCDTKHAMISSADRNLKSCHGASGRRREEQANTIQNDHNYCFPSFARSDFMSDAFIASCLLNPNLEEEVMRETESLRSSNKFGLSSDRINLLWPEKSSIN